MSGPVCMLPLAALSIKTQLVVLAVGFSSIVRLFLIGGNIQPSFYDIVDSV